MTQNILLVLALALGSLTLATPSAKACGGYGMIDPEENAVRATVLSHAQRRAAEGVSPWIWSVAVDGDRATAVVLFSNDSVVLSQHDVRLTRRGDRWRVVAFQRRAA